MQKTIYISEKDQEFFATAQKVLGETSISSAIVSALKYVIDHKSKEMNTYQLEDINRPVNLYGKELILSKREDHEFSSVRAFRTRSGKIIVLKKVGEKLLRYENQEDFLERGSKDFPDDLFRRIKLALRETDPKDIEIID
jgi:hypothetical protein